MHSEDTTVGDERREVTRACSLFRDFGRGERNLKCLSLADDYSLTFLGPAEDLGEKRPVKTS